jgi:predicted nucleotidyltransferase
MNTLEKLLSSRTRAEIFRILFGLNDAELHVREIARRAGCNEATARQELKKLTGLSLVTPRRDGNRLCYRADRDHPLFGVIRDLVLKTSGLADLLRDALRDQPIQFAFVFGSVARGETSATSDIDLMVIADIGLRKLAPLLAGLADVTGREINPHVMSISEYRRRVQAQDHFATNVLKGPRLFVIGDRDEFERLGE